MNFAVAESGLSLKGIQRNPQLRMTKDNEVKMNT